MSESGNSVRDLAQPHKPTHSLPGSALHGIEKVLRKASRQCDSILEGLGPMRQGVPIEYQSHEDQAADA